MSHLEVVVRESVTLGSEHGTEQRERERLCIMAVSVYRQWLSIIV